MSENPWEIKLTKTIYVPIDIFGVLFGTKSVTISENFQNIIIVGIIKNKTVDFKPEN